jgi:shikimate kinase/3-dehydroquinate synthase
MGSGKSTVARAVGATAGLPVWDLDEVVAREAGRSVAALFAERGEPAFRDLERRTLRALVERHDRGVFALGGGTVTDRGLRHDLLRAGTVVTLRAGIDELTRRVGAGEGRPLLADQDVGARLAQLLEARADAYAECHAQIETGGRDVESVVQAVLSSAAEAPIVVPFGQRTYRVEVRRGCRMVAAARVAAVAGSARVVLVTDEVVGPLWADEVAASLREAAIAVINVVLPAGEEHKTLRSVERIWEAALAGGIDRGSAVVSLCGGVVGDLSGFAGSTLLRGIAVGHIPTTLLSMVDSAIGGKTGFDTVEGKNLVGTFHQPSFVLCDVDVLTTLPEAERRAGLAEVVKSAWIEGEAAVAGLERDVDALLAGEPEATERAIRMSATMKARVVTLDERESGLRAVLNLGHTVGHAIEASLGFRGIRHGEAVSLGMVAAFRLAVRLGHAAPADLARLTSLLSAIGLPTAVDQHLNERTLSFIGADKKRRSDRIAFVLPAGPGQVEVRPLSLAALPGLLGA